MDAMRQELAFDTPDGLRVSLTGHEMFPFRLEHEGMAYSSDNFPVDLRTSIDMTRDELAHVVALGNEALGSTPGETVKQTESTVTLVLDKAYLRRLANVLGLDIVAPHERSRDAKVADRIYIDTIQFSTLAEMLGMVLIEGDTA